MDNSSERSLVLTGDIGGTSGEPAMMVAVRACHVLALLVFWKTTTVTDGWTGSKLGTKEYNQELTVIAQAVEDYAKAQQELETRPRQGVLCVTFLRASMDTSVKVTFKNVALTTAFCKWALVIYRGSDEDVANVCSDAALRRGTDIKDQIVHCQRTEHAVERTKNFNQKAVPKTILYRDLLPYLPDYERVFLLDEDISLYGVDLDKYMAIWDCAFLGHAQKPLITQPLIAESTQFFDFVNAEHWKGKRYMAAGVGLIEQQVPFFDAIFFEWFVRRVLVYTMKRALELGADCGHDRSWCNAARMYGRHVLGWSNSSKVRDTPCALITGVSVHHLNLRSMENKRANRDKFRELGHQGVQRYIDNFPTWCLTEIKHGPDPLGKKGYRYAKITSLPEKARDAPQCAALWANMSRSDSGSSKGGRRKRPSKKPKL